MNLSNHSIIFAIDYNFIQQFRVVLFSLYKHNHWIVNVNIYILYSSDTLSSSIQKQLSEECKEKYSVNLNWIKCDSFIGSHLKIHNSDHVTISAYYRLFIQDLLPDFIDYALYLDSDILILGDIKNLFLKKIKNPIAAVDNYAPSESIRLWGAAGGSYFNSGVMIFNLEYIRKYNYGFKYLEILNDESQHLACWDQDVLNIVYKDNWERIDFYFNVTRHLLESFQIINLNFFKKIDKKRIRIIHYDGPNKPWTNKSLGVYDKYWLSAYAELNSEKHYVDNSIIGILRTIRRISRIIKKEIVLYRIYKLI